MFLIDKAKREWNDKKGRQRIIAAASVLLFIQVVVHSPLARAIVGSVFPQNGQPVSLESSPLFTSKERPVIKFTSSGGDRAFVRIYRRTAGGITGGADGHNFRTASPAPYWLSKDEAWDAVKTQTPVFESRVPMRHTDLLQSEGALTLAQPLPKGDYIIAASNDEQPFNKTDSYPHPILGCFRVSDLGLIVKRAPDKVLVQAVDLITKQPVANVPLSVFRVEQWSGTDSEMKYQRDLVTTSDGISEYATPGNSSEGDNYQYFVSAHRGEDLAAYMPYEIGNGWGLAQGQQVYSSSMNDPYRGYVGTDRTVYRLGQTVNFRAVLAKLGPSGIKPVSAGEPVKLAVTDPQGNQCFTADYKVDEQSAVQGAIPISAQGATGNYSARFAVGQSRPNEAQNEIYANIDVQEYRKPEYEVTISPMVPNAVTGGKAHFNVKAKYYFGAPVKNAKIHYVATFSPDYSARNSLLDLPYYCRFYTRWSEMTLVPYGAENSTPVEGNAFTNDKGESIIDIAVPPYPRSAENENKNALEYYDRTMQVNATVTDLSLKTVEASGTVPVPAAAFNIAAKPVESWIVPGGTINTNVTVKNHEDRPVENQVVRIKAIRTEPRFLTNKFDQKVLCAVSGKTDATGHLSLALQLPKSISSGYVTLVAEAQDSAGGRTEDRTNVWVSSDLIKEKPDEESVNVVLDKDVYQLGETAHVTISDGTIKLGEKSHALVSLEGTTIYDRRNVEIGGPITTVDVPLRELYVPNAHVSVAWLGKDHTMQHRDVELRVSPKEKILDIKVASNKKDYRPGEEAEFTVQVKDWQGKPVGNTELSLALTDESIFAIKGESGDTLLSSIYAPIQNYVGTGWNFYPYTTAQPTPVSWWVSYDFPFGFFPWINCSQEELCRERSLHECAPTALPAPCLPMAAPRLQGATNGTIGPLAGGGGEMGLVPPPPPTVRIRKDFRDTAAWLGNVKTDAGGVAKVKVKLPDNLTTWRAVVIGNTGWLGVGQASVKTTASRDLMARLSLPRFYTEGDEAFITGIVHNYTKSPQKVNLSLEPTGNFKSKESWHQSLTIPADDVGEYRWPITVTKYGEAQLLMKAVGQTDADGLEMKLPVRDFSYTDFFAKNGVLDVRQTSQDCRIKVPDDASLTSANYKLFLSGSRIGPVLGNFDTLISYPYGCTEQTISRVIPSVVAMRLHKDLGLALSTDNQKLFNDVYHRAIVKLLDYQNSDGGWGWWKDDTSNPFLTAYVLEGAYMLKQAGFTLDKNLIDGGLDYLQNHVGIGPPASLTEVTDRARVMYVLSLYGKKPQFAQMVLASPMFKATPEALAYMTMAFHNVHDQARAKATYERLCALASESPQYMEWDHTAEMNKKLGITHPYDYDYRYTGIETTALALRATLRMEPSNARRIDQIRDWILIQRDQNAWNDTKTTSAVFIALLEDELSKGKVHTDFKSAAKLADQVVASAAFNDVSAYGPEKSFTVPVKSRRQTMVLDKQGSGRLYYSTVLTCRRPIQPSAHIIPKSLPLEMRVTREFCKLVASGDHIKSVPLKDGDTITAGDTILMKVKIDSPVSLPYVKVEAFLPSGAEITSTTPMPGSLSATTDANAFSWWWTHQDVLDDRIVFFTTSLPNGPCTFSSLLRVEMPGTFNINPVSVEGMYTRKVRAYSDAAQLKVLPN